MTDVKKKKEKVPKPKYKMPACIVFMVNLALKHEPMILWGGLIMTALAVVQNLVNLFISPMVLRAVEQKVPVVELIGTIGLMIGLLVVINCVNTYISGVDRYRKITLRGAVGALINDKCATTSYCNVESEDFNKLKEKAGTCTNSNAAAAESIWETLFGLLRNIAGFIIYILLLTNVEPLLLIIMLATTIPGYYLNKYIGGWGYRHREESADIERAINCTTQAGKIEAAKDIRIFGMRSWFESMYTSSMRLLHAFHMRAARVYIWSSIVDIVLTFLRNGIAYFYLINLVLDGGMAASEFLLYFSAVGGFTGWVWGILSDFASLHNKCLDLSNAIECIRYPEPYKFEDGDPVPCDNNCPAEIRLEYVSFRYPGAEEDTLKNVNLTLHPGERLAIVGLNGAGKTTLVKLISGLYDPTEGRVTWNGVDIRTLNRREYYEKFSAIFQELTTIPGSLAVNVAASETDIDVDKVKHCVAQADLTAKFESLPNGYETTLNREVYEDAVELSGGERQRLMLARALYKDAPVLLLDEPT
ncbi:MAG: ABC transporter ATP-binding protein, partial [Clostridia bacterium]|nr:ABC transporter ATP-binding protein [Clostridia bacterium]